MMTASRRTIALASTFLRRSSSTTTAAAAAAAPASAAASVASASTTPAVVSSVKEGTVLKGINILKDGKDPVAMADAEYPAWLWTLLEPKKLEWSAEEKMSIRYLRTLSGAKIQAFALSKRTK
ncbi:mitochondrial ribosomal protein L37-domain-containing protein [Entophlyctis helioformis]|nr:mitochondrial ribosomal protein L37-domain-containing protein [Entophlyctis helioformis]